MRLDNRWRLRRGLDGSECWIPPRWAYPGTYENRTRAEEIESLAAQAFEERMRPTEAVRRFQHELATLDAKKNGRELPPAFRTIEDRVANGEHWPEWPKEWGPEPADPWRGEKFEAWQ